MFAVSSDAPIAPLRASRFLIVYNIAVLRQLPFRRSSGIRDPFFWALCKCSETQFSSACRNFSSTFDVYNFCIFFPN